MTEKTNIVTTLFLKGKDKQSYGVYYETFDAQNNVIDKTRHACYALLMYGLKKEIVKVVTIQSFEKIPYDWEIIKLWINELNEFGFPCSVEKKEDGNVYFTVLIKDYSGKAHLLSAFSLIRCLFERYHCYVPEIYFNLIKEKKSSKDKFLALQLAHRNLSLYKESSFYNSGHTVINQAANNFITLKELFNNFKKYYYDIYQQPMAWVVHTCWSEKNA